MRANHETRIPITSRITLQMGTDTFQGKHYHCMAVAGCPAGPAFADQFSEERIHRNALSLSTE